MWPGNDNNSADYNETPATIPEEKIRLNGALAGKKEPLHSWVSRSNHELDEQQQVNLVPTAVYSNVICNPRTQQMRLLIYDLYMCLLLTEYNNCTNTRMWKGIVTERKVLWE